MDEEDVPASLRQVWCVPGAPLHQTHRFPPPRIVPLVFLSLPLLALSGVFSDARRESDGKQAATRTPR